MLAQTSFGLTGLDQAGDSCLPVLSTLAVISGLAVISRRLPPASSPCATDAKPLFFSCLSSNPPFSRSISISIYVLCRERERERGNLDERYSLYSLYY